jgi:hypothetical protein
VTVNIYRTLPTLADRSLTPSDFELLDGVLGAFLGEDFGPVGNGTYIVTAAILDATDACLEILSVDPPVPYETLTETQVETIHLQINAARAVAASVLLKLSMDPGVLLSALEGLGQADTPAAKLCEMRLADELAVSILASKSE